MARCPKLDYCSVSIFGNSSDYYICKVTQKQMPIDSSIVKYTCKPDYGEEYRNCTIYKNS